MIEEHLTPPEDLIPFSAYVEYEYAKDLKPLSVVNFIKKFLDAPRSGRLVIAYAQDGRLKFPDEAVTRIQKDNSEKAVSFVSGYYEECDVITPNDLDFNALFKSKDDNTQLIVYTKHLGGKHPVIDIVPFSYEDIGIEYEYIAVVV